MENRENEAPETQPEQAANEQPDGAEAVTGEGTPEAPVVDEAELHRRAYPSGDVPYEPAKS